jgi:hypothetical protein
LEFTDLILESACFIPLETPRTKPIMNQKKE